MKKIFKVALLAFSVILAGCGESGEGGAVSNQCKPPSVSEYRTLLERRQASSGGVTINIRREISQYENLSDDEKIEQYNKVKALVE